MSHGNYSFCVKNCWEALSDSNIMYMALGNVISLDEQLTIQLHFNNVIHNVVHKQIVHMLVIHNLCMLNCF